MQSAFCNHLQNICLTKSYLNKIRQETKDKKICTKVMGLEGHPLYNMLPEVKNTKYELRRKSAVKPKINTKRFMSSFINRLTFKYKLADLFH